VNSRHISDEKQLSTELNWICLDKCENVETRTLAKHIETLRKKLGDAGACIRTVHGVGYRFMSYNASAVR